MFSCINVRTTRLALLMLENAFSCIDVRATPLAVLMLGQHV